MYDELIKRLRETSIDFGELDDVSVMMIEAANAIEELQKQRDEWESHAALAESFVQGWIPVTERLPKENGFYLCLYKHKHPGGVAMDEGLSIVQMYKGKWNLNEIYAVTHWMPLPEPPKEET